MTVDQFYGVTKHLKQRLVNVLRSILPTGLTDTGPGEVLGLRENDKTSLFTELMNTTDYLLLAGSKMISGWVNGKINDLVIL